MRSGSVTPARGGRAVMDRSARPSGTHPRIAVLAGLRRVRHTPMGSERPAGRGPSALEASAGAAHAGVSEARRSTVMMWFGYYDGWSWLLMAGMMVLFWGGIATLIAFVARALMGAEGRRPDHGYAAAAARERRNHPGGVRDDPPRCRGSDVPRRARLRFRARLTPRGSVGHRQVDGGLERRRRSLRALAHDLHHLGVQGLEPAQQTLRSGQARRPEVTHELAASGQP